jgi:hypothetical protein
VKKAILSALAAAVVAGVASPATAAPKSKYKKKHYVQQQPVYDVRYMRIGSQAWWDQMVREDRARR